MSQFDILLLDVYVNLRTLFSLLFYFHQVLPSFLQILSGILLDQYFLMLDTQIRENQIELEIKKNINIQKYSVVKLTFTKTSYIENKPIKILIKKNQIGKNIRTLLPNEYFQNLMSLYLIIIWKNIADNDLFFWICRINKIF